MAQFGSSENWNNISESVLEQNFPLHRACRDGDVEFISNLLTLPDFVNNAQICKEDTYYGWTPLHWASYFGKLDCIRILVTSSDVTSIDLKTSRFNQTPAHIAAFAGHVHCLRWMLEAGANPNALDYLGETALHKSARTGSDDCVHALLDSGVEIGRRNLNGKIAAELARLTGHESIAYFLLNKETEGEVSQFLKFVSSNGSHGNQHTTTDSDSYDPDDNMDMECSSSLFSQTQINTNDTDCRSSITASADFKNNKFTVAFKDVTLCSNLSLNKSTIGGKKRYRADSFSESQIKRVKSEGQNLFLNNNEETRQDFECPVGCQQSLHGLSDQGGDTTKFYALMSDVHGC